MNNKSAQRGFSLIELMISITLGLVILTAIALVLFNASSSRTELERISRQIENGRYAIDVLSSDLRMAGFYGELDVSTLAGSALPTDPCATTVASFNAAIPVHVQGYDNAAAAPGSCALTNLKTGSDVLVVRRVRTCVAGSANCDTVVNGAPYLQVSLCSTDAGIGPLGTDKHVLDTNSASFGFKKKDCTTAADKRLYYTHIYYLSTDNGSGQSIPTLTRLDLDYSSGALTWTTNPLVEGIEEFNLEYGIDTDNDGAPNVYTADPDDYPVGGCSGGCPLNNWMNVVTVQINVLARNLEPSSDYTDSKTYRLGYQKAPNAASAEPPYEVAPHGNYRRHAYSGLVRIANISNRRDTP